MNGETNIVDKYTLGGEIGIRKLQLDKDPPDHQREHLGGEAVVQLATIGLLFKLLNLVVHIAQIDEAM